jgi:hypothetical protein
VWLAPVDKQPQENGPCQILQLSSHLFGQLMDFINVYAHYTYLNKLGEKADFLMDNFAKVDMECLNWPLIQVCPLRLPKRDPLSSGDHHIMGTRCMHVYALLCDTSAAHWH